MALDETRAAELAARIDRADALQARYRSLQPRTRLRRPQLWFGRTRRERAIAALLSEPLP